MVGGMLGQLGDLLGSATLSDVQETLALVITCRQFQVSLSVVFAALSLPWHVWVSTHDIRGMPMVVARPAHQLSPALTDASVFMS